MADLTISDVIWKKGETGTQTFFVKDSDGTTAHNLTGNTYTFKFWLENGTTNKGSGSCSIVNASTGELAYTVTSANTNTVGEYIGEVQETNTGLKTKSFRVSVLESSPDA